MWSAKRTWWASQELESSSNAGSSNDAQGWWSWNHSSSRNWWSSNGGSSDGRKGCLSGNGGSSDGRKGCLSGNGGSSDGPKERKYVTFNFRVMWHVWHEVDNEEQQLRVSVPISLVEQPPRRAIYVSIFRGVMLQHLKNMDVYFLDETHSLIVRDRVLPSFMNAMLDRERAIFGRPWLTKRRMVLTWDGPNNECKEIFEVWNEIAPH